MRASRPFVLTVALAAAMVLPSCRLFRKTPKTAAPPPAPAPSKPAAKHHPAPKPEELPAPPQITPQNADLTKQAPPPEAAAEKLPPRPREHKRPARREPQESAGQPTAQPAPAQPPAEETTEADVPELEQILTPQQRQAYIEEIDSNVGRAQKTVETLQGRRLNGDQKIYLERVRAFIDQAREARKTDLFRAKNLSERASVLAEDLMRSVQ